MNNEEVLTNYFDNYIMQPVLRKAVPSSGGDEAAADDAPAAAADDAAADVSKNVHMQITEFSSAVLKPFNAGAHLTLCALLTEMHLTNY